jgi:hypothetical protein
MSSLQIKLLGLFLLVNSGLAIYYQRCDKLVIYNDFTDAVFTGLAPLAAILTNIFLQFFEIPMTPARIVALFVFSSLMFFVVRSTARENGGFSVFFLMSLLTKLTIVGLYYAVMAMLMYGSSSARRKGESYAAHEARCRKEAKANAVAMAAITAGFIAFSAWVCKNREFTAFGKYLSISKSGALT